MNFLAKGSGEAIFALGEKSRQQPKSKFLETRALFPPSKPRFRPSCAPTLKSNFLAIITHENNAPYIDHRLGPPR